MLEVRKISEIVPSLENVQNLARFLPAIPKIAIPASGKFLSSVRKSVGAKPNVAVINSFLGHRV